MGDGFGSSVPVGLRKLFGFDTAAQYSYGVACAMAEAILAFEKSR
jgi:hypothetical protein